LELKNPEPEKKQTTKPISADGIVRKRASVGVPHQLSSSLPDEEDDEPARDAPTVDELLKLSPEKRRLRIAELHQRESRRTQR
jgi:hypothetical protein